MKVSEVLSAFDQQMRRDPAEQAGSYIEKEEEITRILGSSSAWSGIVWSRLEGDVDQTITGQIRHFDRYPEWEWKLYSYDRPLDLAERLLAAGFVPGQEETLLVAAVDQLDLVAQPPPSVELVEVVDRSGVESLVKVHNEVFGGDHRAIGEGLLAALEEHRDEVVAVVAMAGRTPVAAARAEFPGGRDFASLWGGGTLQAWRGRGVFRSLVAHRARLASSRGYRYLQVDATPESCPILKRLGFVELATTTPYLYR